MSKHVFCRPIRQSDAEQFFKWSDETKNNLYDPTAAAHPTSLTVAAYNEDKVILYAPAQSPFVLEALSVNPSATPLEIATALKEVTQFFVSQCYVQGKGELMFVCADQTTAEYAKRQAYEELPYRLFRIRINDLEPKPNGE